MRKTGVWQRFLVVSFAMLCAWDLPGQTGSPTPLGARNPFQVYLRSPILSGDPTAPTPSADDNDTSIATTAYVQTELIDYALLASPTFTGDPKAPTAAYSDNDTSIATTAFVMNQLGLGISPPAAPLSPASAASLTAGDGLAESTYLTQSDAWRSRLVVSWSAVSFARPIRYRVTLQRGAGTTYQVADVSASPVTIDPVDDLVQYTINVYAYDVLTGTPGTAITGVITTSGITGTPPDVASAGVTFDINSGVSPAVLNGVTIYWPAPESSPGVEYTSVREYEVYSGSTLVTTVPKNARPTVGTPLDVRSIATFTSAYDGSYSAGFSATIKVVSAAGVRSTGYLALAASSASAGSAGTKASAYIQQGAPSAVQLSATAASNIDVPLVNGPGPIAVTVASGTGATWHGALALVGANGTFINKTGGALIVKHESATDLTAANRIVCPKSADLTIPDGGVFWMIYDSHASTNRWRAFASTDWSAATSTPTTLAGYGIAENSAGLAGAISDETGTGVVVLATSPALAGDPTAPTPAGADNDTSLATTAYVQTELTAKAPLASPALTGDPTAPTPAANDNDTSIATTAYAQSEFVELSGNETMTGPLDVTGDSLAYHYQASSSDQGGNIKLRNTDTTITSGNFLGSLRFVTEDTDVGPSETVANMNVQASGTFSSTSPPASWNFDILNGAGSDRVLVLTKDGATLEHGLSTYDRTTADGIWTTYSFNAANFTASTGDWTVADADEVFARYTLVGKTMTVAFEFRTTTVSATPAELRFTIPGSKTAATANASAVYCSDNGTWVPCLAEVDAAATVITFTDQSGAWAAATDTTAVVGQITFEIQ